MSITGIRELLSRSDASGSKSTILKPLTWFLALIIGGILTLLKFGSPIWLTIMLAVIFCLGVAVFFFVYIYCLINDRDSLRSELSTIKGGWNMKKRFVVCYSDNIPKEKEMHFIQFIKDNKLGWWHWISNMWLLVDSSGQMTASILRDKICKLYSENRVMVIELDGDRDTWAGFGPTQPKNMFDWIKQNWGKD